MTTTDYLNQYGTIGLNKMAKDITDTIVHLTGAPYENVYGYVDETLSSTPFGHWTEKTTKNDMVTDFLNHAYECQMEELIAQFDEPDRERARNHLAYHVTSGQVARTFFDVKYAENLIKIIKHNL